jgi:hypothetical protein
VFGNTGDTGGAVAIGYNNTSNTGYITCLSPFVAWRNLVISCQSLTINNNNGSSTTINGSATVTGWLYANNVFNATGGSKIVVQNGQDGGSSRGIYLWTPDDTNWGIYMASGTSLNGMSACDGYKFSSHAVRFRCGYSSDQGFIFENGNNMPVATIRGSDGLTFFNGSVNTPAVFNAVTVRNTSDAIWATGDFTHYINNYSGYCNYYCYGGNVGSVPGITFNFIRGTNVGGSVRVNFYGGDVCYPKDGNGSTTQLTRSYRVTVMYAGANIWYELYGS